MEDLVPFLEDAMRAAEGRLRDTLGRECRICIHVHMSGELTQVVDRIDHEKFRPELQYTLEELMAKAGNGGFVLFMLTCDDEPTAFLYGYTDEGDGSRFFLDSVATLIEGKGIGSILVTLALVYCHDIGYRSVELYTEEVDERGRHLVKFYEDMGFDLADKDPDKGVVMRSYLDASKLRHACLRYIGLERDAQEFSSIHTL
ncbi:GNAT family N-acetyltransferase [Candidatus Bathyarchaeota archaeon]|nr:GNAT family N-acetyltransferase [Candidatus Bathyarchaeota archaeon]